MTKLVEGLDVGCAGVDLTPVVWSDHLQGHRRLTPAESERLASGRPAAAPVPRAEHLPVVVAQVLRFVRRVALSLLRRAHLLEPLHDVRRRVELATRFRWERPLAVELAPGSVLLEIDTVWNQVRVDRERLYRDCRRRGVGLAVLVYDLLPIEHGEWFEASLVDVFTRTLALQAQYADLVLVISDHTGGQLTTWARERGIDVEAPTTVTLGSDVRDTGGASSSIPEELRDATYVLVVGTIEPRKNHSTLLDAFDLLWTERPDLHLVVVGRAGWSNDAVLDRLAAHGAAGRRLHWLQDVDDDELTSLYLSAAVVAVPSITEGFGLPVIEALSLGVPVVSSNGGALPEAGGELVDLVDPLDVAGWVESLAGHVDAATDEVSSAARRSALSEYRPPEWSTTCEQVASLLQQRFTGGDGSAATRP